MQFYPAHTDPERFKDHFFHLLFEILFLALSPCFLQHQHMLFILKFWDLYPSLPPHIQCWEAVSNLQMKTGWLFFLPLSTETFCCGLVCWLLFYVWLVLWGFLVLFFKWDYKFICLNMDSGAQSPILLVVSSSVSMFQCTSVANDSKNGKSPWLPGVRASERWTSTDPAALRPQWLLPMPVPSP